MEEINENGDNIEAIIDKEGFLKLDKEHPHAHPISKRYGEEQQYNLIVNMIPITSDQRERAESGKDDTVVNENAIRTDLHITYKTLRDPEILEVNFKIDFGSYKKNIKLKFPENKKELLENINP